MVVPTELWLVLVAALVLGVTALNGPNVCMVKQKYNITKRVKYRAPMSVRTYEWCLSIPPRCSKWNTEMRDLTRLETEERIAEVSVCCPGYKMHDVSCVPICPNGRTGSGCKEDCPSNKWGPNCVNECEPCEQGSCSPITGECLCQEGWQGESCGTRMPSTTAMTTLQELLTTKATKPTSSPQTTPSTVMSSTERPISITSLSTPSSTKKVPVTSTTPTNMMIEKQQRDRHEDETQSSVKPTSPTFRNATISPDPLSLFTENTTEGITAMYNRTDTPFTKISTKSSIEARNTMTTNPTQQTTALIIITTEATRRTTPIIVQSTRPETTRSETTIRTLTTKFKPKEIWIRPAQKGETNVETKIKVNESQTRHRSVTSKDIPANTTPKTIIVSIIPTSVSYATFKKIALTSASHVTENTTEKVTVKTTEQAVTKPMTVQTTPKTIKPNTVIREKTPSLQLNTAIIKDTTSSLLTTNATISVSTTANGSIKSYFNGTNSMTTVNHKYSNDLLTPVPSTNSTLISNATISTDATTKSIKDLMTSPPVEVTEIRSTTKRNIIAKADKTEPNVVRNKANATKTNTKTKFTTESPEDEETFHILTEPEHITAVMGDKGTDRSSVDLISVISIAGGIMMAVITVAVVIVMVERCKRPRYEDVRKMNDINMQVMIDNNDVPPPYVRSIFHTPLPDPPDIDKCHYQPISTLDRNLKQFMRPVVVQTISPIMLENFRGILECHYDHLPRRSHEFATIQTRHSCTPSMEKRCELDRLRESLTESTIEALKCEAKLDVIDNTTSEPLYAEIPCWRPPSEHAIEIMNLNGEAVTEL